MSYLYFKVDEKVIKNLLKDKMAARSDVQDRAYSVANNLFARAHSALMKEFIQHPITRELKQGNTAENYSNTLGDNGNLFAFLGFWEGQDPTWELEEILQRINIRKSSHKNGVVYFRIDNIPNKYNIKEATPMNWGSASWADAIESGNFGGGADLSHFIFKSVDSSRSKMGIQTEEDYTEDDFKPKPYMTEILENFQSRINNSNSKYLV